MIRSRRALVAFALLLLSVACTVPTNDEPIELSGSIVPETTTSSSTTSPEVETRQVEVYLLATDDGTTTLEPVPRDVPRGSGVQGTLSNLFTQRPSDERPLEADLSTAIPESAELVSATPDPDVANRLVVDVRRLFGIEGIQGADLRDALAQIVWTATANDSGITEVLFRQDGQPRDALIDNLESTADPVVRGDYAKQS